MDNYRQFFLILITVFASIFVACLLGLWVGAKGVILGIILVPLLVLSYRYPYWGLLAFLIYLPFAGTITYAIAGVFQAAGAKVTFNNASYALFQLAKDIFYFPALLAIVIIPRHWQIVRGKLRPWLIAIAILLVACLFSLMASFAGSSGRSPLVGLVGLKVMVGYMPWLLCGLYLINDRRCLLWVLRLWLVLILICCGLALIQYGLLATGVCPGNVNLPDPISKRATLQAQCFVGGSLLYNPAKGLLRLPGTFVAPWQWAWFLISSSFISYGARFIEPSALWRSLGGLAMAMVLVATLVSGQIAALIIVPAAFLLQLLLTEKRQRSLGIKLGLIALASLIVVTQIGFIQQRLAFLVSRWQYSPPFEFVVKQIKWILSDKLTVLGNGLGTTSSAARRLGNIQLIEAFHAKILYEIGILGFLAFLGVIAITLWLTWQAYRSLQDPKLKQLGLCLWLFLVLISLNPYYYPLMVDPVTVYYWLVAGILLKLPDLEQSPLPENWRLPPAWRKGYVPLDQDVAQDLDQELAVELSEKTKPKMA